MKCVEIQVVGILEDDLCDQNHLQSRALILIAWHLNDNDWIVWLCNGLKVTIQVDIDTLYWLPWSKSLILTRMSVPWISLETVLTFETFLLFNELVRKLYYRYLLRRLSHWPEMKSIITVRPSMLIGITEASDHIHKWSKLLRASACLFSSFSLGYA